MKKAFAAAILAVWTLAFLIAIGFAVVGEVNATNRLPWENHTLRQEILSLKFERQKLLDILEVERTRQEGLTQRLSVGHRLLLFVPPTDDSISLGPWPHEE